MECDRDPDRFRQSRVDAIVAAARPYPPGGADWERREQEWMGPRPMTTDGLPLIGPLPGRPGGGPGGRPQHAGADAGPGDGTPGDGTPDGKAGRLPAPRIRPRPSRQEGTRPLCRARVSPGGTAPPAPQVPAPRVLRPLPQRLLDGPHDLVQRRVDPGHGHQDVTLGEGGQPAPYGAWSPARPRSPSRRSCGRWRRRGPAAPRRHLVPRPAASAAEHGCGP